MVKDKIFVIPQHERVPHPTAKRRLVKKGGELVDATARRTIRMLRSGDLKKGTAPKKGPPKPAGTDNGK